MPQLQEDSEDFIFEQDSALPHFHFDICAHLNANFPHRWIGRASDNDSPLHPWPPQSLGFQTQVNMKNTVRKSQ
jgi:hypothetical protein